MDLTAFETGTVAVGLALFVITTFLCWRLLQRKRDVLLLLWPVLIYFCGPTMTSMFMDNHVLARYVFADSALAETLVIFAYVAMFYVLDRTLNISASIRASFSSPEVRRLAYSPVFLFIYIPVALAAVILQLRILRDFGSALAGGEYQSQAASEGLIPYWGFLSGLYEILFVFVVLFLLSEQRSMQRVIVLGLYALAALLRVAAGTRLLLIKELAIMLIMFYMQGKIRLGRLVLAGAIVVALGSLVGLLRSSGSASTILGPLYGLVMESGLNALTFNIAYQVQSSGFVGQHANLLDSLQFITLSSIPSFLRFGVGQADLDLLSPYNQAIAYGFDSSMPVGGMSGFATLCYLFGSPLLGTLVLVVVIACLLKYTSKGPWKHIIVLVFSINAIHFWRDPVDIAVKNTVQDIVCALVLLYVPNVRRPAVTARAWPATTEVPA